VVSVVEVLVIIEYSALVVRSGYTGNVAVLRVACACPSGRVVKATGRSARGPGFAPCMGRGFRASPAGEQPISSRACYRITPGQAQRVHLWVTAHYSQGPL